MILWLCGVFVTFPPPCGVLITFLWPCGVLITFGWPFGVLITFGWTCGVFLTFLWPCGIHAVEHFFGAVMLGRVERKLAEFLTPCNCSLLLELSPVELYATDGTFPGL